MTLERWNDLVSRVNALAPNVIEFLLRDNPDLVRIECDLDEIGQCDSPIEQLMMLALVNSTYPLEQQVRRNGGPACSIIIDAQYPIQQTRYRVDFLVSAMTLEGKKAQIIVECDGHDFHEKTKTQAAHDKARDRRFQHLGYTVLHFTGSEIHRNPGRCSSEVLDLIVKELNLREFTNGK